MAGNGVTFNLGIKTTADLRGFDEIKKSLQEVKNKAGDIEIKTHYSDADINKMLTSAKQLETALQNAFDPDLNTININKFNSILKQSGTNIQQIREGLYVAGTAGEQAFLKATSSLMQMNTVVKQSNKFLDRMATTFMNTLRYNISASFFNNITGAVQKAYGYVQRLDSSLNDIRIVSGQSAEDMEKFAIQANNAAKALGSSTLDYTDASLIYYQQGLRGEAVTDRTDVTVKMANVLGESASQVSDYMTAIWNNFDDGSKSLEYYADVITKLGASTASSSEEIAEGLGKFAAVADTVGLSYEYATAALATVVAETRQSADIVGTAFKTLFARIQDLELGKTLDDGTTLGKYSQALAAVGVDIKDANGEMKKMDQILEEMGSKWQTLNDAQKTALAQNVAGTRQYTQLVALMENWSEVKENIDLAANAEGNLNKQNDIYLESMEAHLNKLQAASQDLYNNLFDTDDAKGIIDALTAIVQSIANVVEEIGGLKALLPALGSIGLSVFSNQISQGLSSMIVNLNNVRKALEDDQMRLRQLKEMFGDGSFVSSLGGNQQQSEAMSAAMKDMLGFMKEMQQYSSVMTEDQRKSVNDILKAKEAYYSNKIALEEELKIVQELNDKYNLINTDLSIENDQLIGLTQKGTDLQNIVKAFEEGLSANAPGSKIFEGLINDLKDYQGNSQDIIDALSQKIQDLNKSINIVDASKFNRSINGILNSSRDITKQLTQNGVDIEKFKVSLNKAFNNSNGSVDSFKKRLNSVLSAFKITGDQATELKTKLTKAFNIAADNPEKLKEEVEQIVDDLQKMADGCVKVGDSANKNFNDASEAAKRLKENLDVTQSINNITVGLGAIGSLASGLRSLGNIEAIVSNDSLSNSERMLEIITTLSFSLPMVAKGLNEINVLLGGEGTILQGLVSAIKTKVALSQMDQNIQTANNVLNKIRNKDNATYIKILELYNTEGQKEAAIEQLRNTLKEKGIILNGEEAESLLTLKTAQEGYNLALLSSPIGWIIGIITVLVAVLKGYDIALKNAAEKQKILTEASQKYYDKTKEHAQVVQEEADNINKLANAYEKLYEQYSKNELSTKEMKTQSSELCNQYGKQEYAIMALAGQYDILANSIKEAQKEANLDAIEAQTKSVNAGKRALGNSAYQTSLDNSSAWGNITSLDFTNKANSLDVAAKGDSKLALEGFALGLVTSGGILSVPEAVAGYYSGKANSQDKLDELSKQISDLSGGNIFDEKRHSLDFSKANMAALAENRERIEQIINDNYEELGDQPGFKNLKEWFDSNADNLESMADSYSQIVESKFNNINLDNSLTKDSDLTDVQALKEQLREAYQEVYGEIDINDSEGITQMNTVVNEWLRSAYSNNEETATILNKDLIIQHLEKEGREVSEEVQNYIKGLSDSQAAFLSLHVELITDESDIEKTVENYKGYIEDVLDKKDANIKIKAILDDDTKHIDKATLNSLYEDDNFKNNIGLTQAQFENLSIDEQKAKLEEFYNWNNEQIQKNKDAQISSFQEEETRLTGLINYTKEVKQQISSDLEDDYSQEEITTTANEIAPDSLSEYIGNTDALVKLYIKYKDNLDSCNDEEKQFIETLINKHPYMQQDLDSLYTVTKQENQYSAELKAVKNALEDCRTEEEEYAKSLETIQAERKKANSEIDSLQSAYSDLKEIVADYNNDGFLTIDNLQKLCEMNPQYLVALEETSNGYQVNKEKLLELTKVQLRKLQLDIALEAQATINNLTSADSEKQQAAWNTILAESTELTAANTAEIMKNTKAKIENMYEDGKMNAAERKDALSYLDGVQKQIDAVAKTANNLSIDNFDDNMSSSKSSKKDKEHMKEVIDVYHQYERQLKACKAAQDELTERQSHLKGKQLLKNLNAQNEALKQQVEIQQALNAEYAKQAQLLQSKLSSQGATFDGNGEISNYQALLEQAQAKYNAAVDAYNKNKTDANEKAIDNAKQEYDNLKSMISEYEKAVEGLQSAQKAMNELMQKQADVALAKLETEWEIEFQIDTHKAQRKLEDFINTLNDDFRKSFKDWEKEFKNASDKFFYSGLQEDIINQIKEIEDIEKFMDDTKQRANEEFRTYVIDNFMEGYDPTKEGEYTFQEGDIFTSASDASEYLLKLGDQLEELAGQLKEAYETAWEAYLEGIDQAIEETERLNNIIDKNINKLEQYRKIQTLALNGGESTSNTLEYNQTLNKQYDAQIKAFTTQKSKLEGYLATTGITLKKDATGAIDESAVNVLAMDEDQKKIYDQILTYQDQILDTTVKRVETEKEILNLQAQQTLEKTATDLFGSSDVDYLKQQWEDALKWEERYYDGNEKIYQLEQLGKKYDDLKTKNMSLKTQQKINEAKQKELDELSQSVNLSKDELALAEKRLEVTQAEIALEEAQNNKNTMKLTRDESGNWTYQYVANEDDVESKQQDLIDKSYEYYELAKEAYENGVEYAFNIWETYKEKITDLINDQSISDEERSLRLQELTNQTKTYIESCATDTSKFMVDLNTSEAVLLKNTLDSGQIGMDTLSEAQKALVQATNDANVQDLQQTRDEMKDVNSQLSESARDTLTQDTEFFATKASEAVGVWKSKEAEITISITNASNTVQTKISEYQGKINEYARIIGLDLTNVSKSYQGITDSTEKATNAANNYISSQMAKLLGVKAEIDKIKAAWDIVAAACTNAANSMQSYIKQTQAAVRAAESLASATAKATAEVEKLNAAQSKSSSTGGDKTRISATTIAAGQVYTLGSKTIARQDQNGKYYVTGSDKALTRSQFEDEMKRLGYTLGSLGKFDTGGYTGSWTNGSQENNGRLAFLHQKELVLNESDTSNMLEMVNIVRNMQSASGAIDKAILGGIANMISAVTGVKVQDINNTTNSSNNNTANTFNITAEFPNANDVNDIREAILSLPNLAQQYISMNTL